MMRDSFILISFILLLQIFACSGQNGTDDTALIGDEYLPDVIYADESADDTALKKHKDLKITIRNNFPSAGEINRDFII